MLNRVPAMCQISLGHYYNVPNAGTMHFPLQRSVQTSHALIIFGTGLRDCFLRCIQLQLSLYKTLPVMAVFGHTSLRIKLADFRSNV